MHATFCRNKEEQRVLLRSKIEAFCVSRMIQNADRFSELKKEMMMMKYFEDLQLLM